MDEHRLGVDIGGTFTDAVLMNMSSGRVAISKVLTTPGDPAVGFMEALTRLVDENDLMPDQITDVVHATTIATNAVLERKGSRVGLLVTRGFRDVLEIGRQVRYELYNLQTEKPSPLVPRELTCEASERVDRRGIVLEPLCLLDVEAAAAVFHEADVDCVAVCFLHSYRFPEHERQAGALLQELLPEATICLSSDIAPEMREYPRASTAVINAYVAPLVSDYLGRVEQNLHDADLRRPVRIMQSNGGIVSLDAARQRPVGLIESGPAAGVTAASFIAQMLDIENVISFDMGGTTAKMGLVLDGAVSLRSEFEVAATGSVSGSSVARGSGYPILGAVMDLVEVGAGGGSIAWVDSGGALRVGPVSAGADPGPACYGRGGSRPTVTDANLVLGRLDPDYFLGGLLELSEAAAYDAVQTCADALGVDVLEAAMGIVDVANAAMVRAMRLVTVERGYDPREFALVASGGAGALHAATLADALGVRRVVVPDHPGVASAFGLVVSDCRVDIRRAHLHDVDTASPDQLSAIFIDLEDQARSVLEADRSFSTLEFKRHLDLRYVGQSWTLPVDVVGERIDTPTLSEARAGFDVLHVQSYGFSVPEESVEIVNVAVTATGRTAKPSVAPAQTSLSSPMPHGVRDVFFGQAGAFIPTKVFRRERLTLGYRLDGPLLLESLDSTIVVPPEWQATSTAQGLVQLDRISAAP